MGDAMMWYLCMLILGAQMECFAPPVATLEECKAAAASLQQQIELEKTKKGYPPIIGCFGTPQAFPAPVEERGAEHISHQRPARV